jgi:hypothetical protein
MLAAITIVYNLLNPLFYLIDPVLAPMYTVHMGFSQPPSYLLPNIVATAVFLICLGVRTGLARPMHAVVSTTSFPPIPAGRLNSLFSWAIGLAVLGFVFYVARNLAAFGAWNGSFAASYSGETARPQIVLLSSYTTFWTWTIQIISVICFWQRAAGRIPRWMVLIPILAGSAFAIVEGDRVLAGSAILLFVGWYGLRVRLTRGRIAGCAVIVTVLTLTANARFRKDEASFVERIQDIFRPEYFRPFWSSDPSGPSFVATVECARVGREGVSLGSGYLLNLVSMAPKALWPDRPEGPSVRFLQRFAASEGEEYADGTSFAFNAIAESFVEFWYIGVAVLGFLCGSIAAHITRVGLQRQFTGRVLFAFGVQLFVWNVPRNSMMVFVSPLMLLNYFLVAVIIRSCYPTVGRRRAEGRSIDPSSENDPEPQTLAPPCNRPL